MANETPLFPLKLVDFEHYMFEDDSAAFPMTIPVYFSLSGKLDRECFENAFQQIVSENPLLRAKVEKRGSTYYWVEADEPKITWTDELPDIVRVDLSAGVGVQVFIQQVSEHRHEVRMFVHHSVVDGLAVTQLVESWLWEYGLLLEDAGSPSEAPASKRPIATTRALRDRGLFGLNFFTYLMRIFQEFCGYLGVFEFFSHRPVALGPQSEKDSPGILNSPSLALKQFCFDKDDAKKVLQNAKAAGYSVNDLCLGAFYDTSYHWLAEHYPSEADRYIRIMIPTNLRDPKKVPPIANQVSMIFLDRRPGAAKSFRSTVWWVWLEMFAVKSMKLGLTFIHLLKLMKWWGLLPKLLRRDRAVATTILSNMGKIFPRSPLLNSEGKLTAKGLVLETIHFFPPVRPFTWVTSVVSTYANQMRYDVTYCRDAISDDQVEQLFNQFKDRLVRGLETES